MKYLAFTIIFLASCEGSNTHKTNNSKVEYYDRYEVIESGNKYILYKSYSGHTVVIDATKDSLTTELLKQTLKRNDN